MREQITKNKQAKILPHSKERFSFSLKAGNDVYTIGPLKYPIEIVGTSNHQYKFQHTDQHFKISNSFQDQYEKVLASLKFNNQYHMRCKNINITEKNITLDTEWTDFASFLATNKTRNYAELENPQSLTPKDFSNELAVVVNYIIEENDKKYLLLTKRSKHLKNYPNCMSTGASGAMGGEKRCVDFDSAGAPSPLLTAQRETFEELGIEVDLNTLHFTGLANQVLDKQLIFLITGILQTTREEITQKLFQAEDKDEIEEDHLFFIPFQLESIIPYLLYLEWSPISAVAVWKLLIKEFSREAVDKVVRELL
jgi:8-oxo-dGTP pyrophosphatase MutT (NUDIX family)